jgi:hypothetical protein
MRDYDDKNWTKNQVKPSQTFHRQLTDVLEKPSRESD